MASGAMEALHRWFRGRAKRHREVTRVAKRLKETVIEEISLRNNLVAARDSLRQRIEEGESSEEVVALAELYASVTESADRRLEVAKSATRTVEMYLRLMEAEVDPTLGGEPPF